MISNITFEKDAFEEKSKLEYNKKYYDSLVKVPKKTIRDFVNESIELKILKTYKLHNERVVKLESMIKWIENFYENKV